MSVRVCKLLICEITFFLCVLKFDLRLVIRKLRRFFGEIKRNNLSLVSSYSTDESASKINLSV